jgi:hypothetical protein
MRRYLLEKGIIREKEISMDDLRKLREDRGRIIAFNGLR